MRRTRPNRSARARAISGLTLIELVVAMVLVAIIIGATIYFATPLRQAVDLTARAGLTDIADNALQRLGRDVRLALPNSVRVDATRSFIEFIPVREAGRYRAEGGGPVTGLNCPPTADGGSDQLSFDVADGCFKTIGTMANAGQILANSDFLIFNNYGQGFTGQDAYANGAVNRVLITSLASPPAETARHRFEFGATTLQRTLHDSPGKRFYVVTTPVSYACDTGARTLTRHSGYGFTANGLQPTSPVIFNTGTSALLATHVTGCVFDYSQDVAAHAGILTLRLTLSSTLSGGGTETVSLYHAIHVSNLP